MGWLALLDRASPSDGGTHGGPRQDLAPDYWFEMRRLEAGLGQSLIRVVDGHHS